MSSCTVNFDGMFSRPCASHYESLSSQNEHWHLFDRSKVKGILVVRLTIKLLPRSTCKDLRALARALGNGPSPWCMSARRDSFSCFKRGSVRSCTIFAIAKQNACGLILSFSGSRNTLL
jgi:hypothetical protein